MGLIRFFVSCLMVGFGLATSSAQGLPLPIQRQGEFFLRAPVTVSKSWRSETVDPRTESGKERLRFLRSQGWTCEARSSFQVCRGPDAQTLTTDELEEIFDEAAARGSLVLFPPRATPSIFVEAEDYVEFLHEQKIQWGESSWPRFRIFQKASVSAPLNKLNLIDSEGVVLDAFVISENELIHSRMIRRTRSRWIMDMYLVEERYSP